MFRRGTMEFLAGIFLLLIPGVAFAAPAAAVSPAPAAAANRPNIVWIIAEDMGPEQGFFGEPQARTPNFDALARAGMVFNRAFSTAPICSISRSAFMTGMYSTSFGAHQHRTPNERKRPLPEGVKLMTHRLVDAGYTTAHLQQLAAPGEKSDIKGNTKTDWNFTFPGKAYQVNDLNELKNRQPFFAQVGFSETHRGDGWDEASSQVPHPADPAKVRLPPYYPDHPIARADWARYLDNVALFDMKLGFVLQRLREEGLDRNTIVMVFADHGRAMPRAKQWLWDSGLQVPLVIRWPEAYPAPAGYVKGRTDQLVSLIDVTATTLSLAGVDLPMLMQGRPFLGGRAEQLRYLFAARDRADETVDRIRSVRDTRFRYIRNYYPERPYSQQNLYKETEYPILRLLFRMKKEGTLKGAPALFMAATRPPEELYDTLADPYEINNLASDPRYRSDLERLSGALDGWEIGTNDQGRFPEPPEVAAAIAKATDEMRADQIADIVKREGPWR